MMQLAFKIKRYKKRLKIIYHDLKAELNPEIIATIGEVNYISHLAAGSHVDRSITHPLEFVMDNIVVYHHCHKSFHSKNQ